MANAVKGEVPLILKDKRALTLVFDHEALIEAESIYGKPLVHLLADSKRGFMGAIRALLFGATRAHHDEMSRAEVSEMLFGNLEEVTRALEAAIDVAMPEAKPSAGGKAAPAVRPKSRQPGKRSGGNGAKRA